MTGGAAACLGTSASRTPEAVTVFAPLRCEAWALRAGAAGLRVECTGAGPERSRNAVAAHGDDRGASVVVAGVCGSVDPALRPGSVFVPDTLLWPDGREQGIEADPLRDALRERGLASETGALVGSDRLVRGEARDRLFAAGARAVDMESPWLADAASGRPFAVVRVVVDAPGEELVRLGTVRRGLSALSLLRRVAPAIVDWAARVAQSGPFLSAVR